MKNFVLGCVCAIILLGAVTIVSASERKIIPNAFPIIVNGEQRGVAAYNIDGSTFVGLRSIAELIDGVDVDFVDGKIIINSSGSDNLNSANSHIWVEIINGVQYVPAFMINRPSGTGWDFPDGVGGVLNLIDFSGTGLTTIALLENIPYITHNGAMHIPLNFYENTLRPLIESLTAN